MKTVGYRVIADSCDKDIGSRTDYTLIDKIFTYSDDTLIGMLRELTVVDDPYDTNVSLLIGTLEVIEGYVSWFEELHVTDGYGMYTSVTPRSFPNSVQIQGIITYMNDVTDYRCFTNGEKILTSILKNTPKLAHDSKFLENVGKLILDSDEDELEKLLSKKKLAMNLKKADIPRLTREVNYLNDVLDNLEVARTKLINAVQSLV